MRFKSLEGYKEFQFIKEMCKKIIHVFLRAKSLREIVVFWMDEKLGDVKKIDKLNFFFRKKRRDTKFLQKWNICVSKNLIWKVMQICFYKKQSCNFMIHKINISICKKTWNNRIDSMRWKKCLNCCIQSGGAYITILYEEVKVGMEFKKNVQLLLNETGVFQFNHYFRKKR